MDAQPRGTDLEAVKERQRRAWASGDYAAFGAPLLIMGELLCEAVDLRPGWRVLDVATGSGNTALAAARRSCEVTGADYVPTLLERGRERAAAERLEVSFLEGDAEDLPFPASSFDAVLSSIGVMFAPDQERTAGELLRVCRSGGRIGLANWTPDGFASELAALFGRYADPVPGFQPPALWGTEERLRELLGGGVDSLKVARRSFVFRYRSVEHYTEVLRNDLGPTRQTFEGLDAAGQRELEGELADLVCRFNRSGDETMVVPSDYLEVVALRR
ncbi:MAG: methyltransferase domain-containing protein [Actinomycetota bacterium]|nr:methyltransferase domain-containing protein [Actinomycetota bacterium]